MSKKLLSTLIRDLADVSRKVQLNDCARASPSVEIELDAVLYSAESRYLTLPRDFALALQIALVANNDHREVVLVLDAQDLLLEGCDFLKALTRGDGVDEQETLACPHVLLAHRAVLLLTGGIENIEQSDLIINYALFAVRVWIKSVLVKVRGQTRG